MGFGYVKNKIINMNMAKLKLDQHHFKIQYKGIIGIISWNIDTHSWVFVV